MGVDELLAGAPIDGEVRVEGEIIAGSFVRHDSPCEFRFSIERNGFRMPVRLPSCVVSDPLEAAVKDGGAVPVTVSGTLQPGGFVASNVFAHVPSCCFCTPEDEAKQIRAWRERARTHPDPSTP